MDRLKGEALERWNEALKEAREMSEADRETLESVARKAYELGRRSARTTPRLAQMRRDPEDPRHGTLTGYTAGCRCQDCKDANARYMRERRRSRG